MLSTMQDTPLSISRILRYGATVHGSTTVTVWSDDEPTSTTFAEISARAGALANALYHELGITGDQRVATLMYNCAEHVEAMFGVSAMGAIFTPLNRALLNDQLHYVLAHSGAEVVIVDPRLLDQIAEVMRGVDSVRALVVIGLDPVPHDLDGVPVYSYEALLDGQSTTFPWPVLDERTAAAICYSTATSGLPKGVAYSHRSIYLQTMSLCTTNSLAVSHGNKFLLCVPIYHVLSWGIPFAAFMAGTDMVLPDADVSPPTLATIIENTHPRVAHGIPSLWNQLMVHYLNHPPGRMSLTEIYVGGSPATPALVKVWEEQYGVDIVHVWGMTETGTVGTVSRPPTGVSGESRWAYRASQGRFAPSLEYRVVNDGEVVASTDRNQGEIQVRGPIVTGSYLSPAGAASDTAPATFRGHDVPSNFGSFTADGWLRTGDVGSITSDGFLQVIDRARDVIRSGGEWIYSAQVENVIMESEHVIECAVIGMPDEKWGERPLAVTVLLDGVPANEETAEDLRRAARTELPNWMVPEYWCFVSSIDKTSVGKFDKKDLRAHLANNRFNVLKLAGPGSN